MPTVSCPSCSRPLEVDDAYRDWTVRCPHCDTEFVPAAVAPPPSARPEREDPDEAPRRAPERDENRAEAARLAHGPGVWLEVCGWVGGLLLAGGAFLQIAAVAMQPNLPANQSQAMVLLGVLSGALALPYAVVMVVGGRKLRALSGYGWATTASVVGICSLALVCLMCVCAFAPVGFGIWGIVTLNNPVVQRAFERSAAPPRRWDE